MAKIRTRSRFWLWLIRMIGVIVPRRLRADWRQEWEAELNHREALLAQWDRLDWRNKLDLLRRSTSAFWDALWMQTYRWEDAMIQDLRYGVRVLLSDRRTKCFKTCDSVFEGGWDFPAFHCLLC